MCWGNNDKKGMQETVKAKRERKQMGNANTDGKRPPRQLKGILKSTTKGIFNIFLKKIKKKNA